MSGVDEGTTSLSTPPKANERTISNGAAATQSHPEISRQNEQGTSTQAEPYIQMAESESQRNDGLVVTSTSATIPDAWQEKSLLSFDGGGIRGYASLLMLEKLMEQIGEIERKNSQNHEAHSTSYGPFERPPLTTRGTGIMAGAHAVEYLPCHYFDYIVGTSTGGLIATMLSRWRMSVAECIQKYDTLGGQIFGQKRLVSVFGYPKCKHSKKPLIAAIKELADQRTPKTEGKRPEKKIEMFPSPPDLCRTIVVAIRKGKTNKTPNEPITISLLTDGPFLFRSYTPCQFNEDYPPLNYGENIKHEIWKVCRATTAAPFYFEPQIIGDDEFCDGGAGVNNPAMKAYQEMTSLHENQLKILASFGTGKPVRPTTFRDRDSHRLHIGKTIRQWKGWVQTLKGALTECEDTHREVVGNQIRARHGPGKFNYFRLNVEEDLGKVKLDEWKDKRDDGNGSKTKTLEYIRKCTEGELSKVEVQKQLAALAKLLVELRRCRVQQDQDRWERFANCTLYKCSREECINGDKALSFTLRREMKEHLQTVHPVPRERIGSHIEADLDSCRRMPDFPAGPF